MNIDKDQIFCSTSTSLSSQEDERINSLNLQNKFINFIKQFYPGNNVNFLKYRIMIRQNYLGQKYFVEVEHEDIQKFDDYLAEELTKFPAKTIVLLQPALMRVASEILDKRKDDIEVNIHLILSTNLLIFFI